jgi:glucose-1-phosphate adenylyltransferase
MKVLAVILAGGRGERLYPLTRDRAKPAVPFGGIYRIIDFTLSNCINSDIRHIYALTQYKSTSLHRHIQLGWSILASPLGEFIEVIPAQQRSTISGIRHGGRHLSELLPLQEERPDVVLSVRDHIYKWTIGR